MLNGGPPSSRHSIATAAELVPKWACRCGSLARRNHARSTAASTKYAMWRSQPRSDRQPVRDARRSARPARRGWRSSSSAAVASTDRRPPPNSTRVLSRSRRSARSTSCSAQLRTENRWTSTPSCSIASISRRMKVWLPLGYWLTRYATRSGALSTSATVASGAAASTALAPSPGAPWTPTMESSSAAARPRVDPASPGGLEMALPPAPWFPKAGGETSLWTTLASPYPSCS